MIILNRLVVTCLSFTGLPLPRKNLESGKSQGIRKSSESQGSDLKIREKSENLCVPG